MSGILPTFLGYPHTRIVGGHDTRESKVAGHTPDFRERPEVYEELITEHAAPTVVILGVDYEGLYSPGFHLREHLVEHRVPSRECVGVCCACVDTLVELQVAERVLWHYDIPERDIAPVHKCRSGGGFSVSQGFALSRLVLLSP